MHKFNIPMTLRQAVADQLNAEDEHLLFYMGKGLINLSAYCGYIKPILEARLGKKLTIQAIIMQVTRIMRRAKQQ